MLLKTMVYLFCFALLIFIGLVLLGAFSQYQDEALTRGFEGAWERFQASRDGYSEPGPWHEKQATDRNKKLLPDFEE